MTEPKTANIVCCTDFSENALVAFQEAVAAAARYPHARLYLLHVIPEPDSQFWKTYIYQADFNIDEKAKADIDQRVDQDYRPKVPEGIELLPAYRIGRDYEKILEFLQEVQADLAVVGRQGGGSSRLRSFFFGNVASRVVSQSPCPVLVVPAKR